MNKKMVKIIGYSLSIAGLVIIALSSKIAQLSFLASNPKALVYTSIVGVALVAAGVVLVMSKPSSSSKINQAAEEVPIYHGEGKNRKIVAYRKESKK